MSARKYPLGSSHPWVPFSVFLDLHMCKDSEFLLDGIDAQFVALAFEAPDRQAMGARPAEVLAQRIFRADQPDTCCAASHCHRQATAAIRPLGTTTDQ